ncbi:serine hydrolase domain-containing protein [Hymenobacter cheonanensis]|uniref:serine hydrolase domain-containing protein n=1 Tax=Hymenobacter sp. CA2-7 TaxID=3063993 RepID=UPI0027142329|nr:serine hydrolase domain-containing protein [Hymenobacter sp. CA2-7]MDO7887354.1 serine hydrolase domain-containing protein [Hymenobacter sp. CA2-7]
MRKNLFAGLLMLGTLGTATPGWAQPAAGSPALLPAAAPASVGVSPEGLKKLDQLLQGYVADGRLPGVIALVARDGKVVYRQAFGYADAQAKTPLRPNAIERIASQTKAITSVGLMELYDQGKFQLDDPISKYLPAFAHPRVLATFNAKDTTFTTVPARSEITIRQLLTHTSGIGYAVIGSAEARAIYAKAHVPSGVGSPPGTLAPAIDALARQPLMHQPGARFTYGLSVDVLGRLIEVLSGQPLDQYLRARVFEPLGMTDTYFYLPADRQRRLVPLYTEYQGRTVPMPASGMLNLRPDFPNQAGTYFSGGGGLSSTIDDYAVFLQMLLNGGTYGGHRLLKPSTVALMTQNQIGDVTQGLNKFGLGFSIVTPAGAAQTGQSVGSYEWGGAFGTDYWVDPKEHLVVLLYTQKFPHNNTPDLVPRFRKTVYAALAKRQAK